MGNAGTSAEALIEILNLCEQTLTSLNEDWVDSAPSFKSDQVRRTEHARRSKFARHLFLIRGGLSKIDRQPQVR